MLSIKLTAQKTYKKLIKFLAKIFGEELAKWLFYLFLTLIIGSGTLTALPEYMRDALLRPIITLLTSQLKLVEIRLTLIFLLLTFFYLFLLFEFGYLLKAYLDLKHPYYFYDDGKCKWKIEKKTGRVDELPSCREHQTKLIVNKTYSSAYFPIFKYYCPICGDKNTQDLNSDFLSMVRLRIIEIAKAKAEGYLKEEI